MEYPTATFLRGIPASGKSTLARKMARETGALRLNLDTLRQMFGQPWSRSHERFVQSQLDSMAISALRSGQSIIHDNTNIFPKNAKRLGTLIWEAGLPVSYEIVDVVADQDTALARNQYRRESPQFEDSMAVPDDVIRKMSKQIDSKRRNGDLWTVADITAGFPEIESYVPDRDLPSAVVFDVDGTLADGSHRDPYDHSLCGNDLVHQSVANAARRAAWNGLQVVICSGRDEGKFGSLTVEWLAENGIPYDLLLMRRAGDERRDSIVKYELFDRAIRPNYNVEVWLDDRDRVVNIMRAVGVKMFQVAPGDF
jgi:predicted kinase